MAPRRKKNKEGDFAEAPFPSHKLKDPNKTTLCSSKLTEIKLQVSQLGKQKKKKEREKITEITALAH